MIRLTKNSGLGATVTIARRDDDLDNDLLSAEQKEHLKLNAGESGTTAFPGKGGFFVFCRYNIEKADDDNEVCELARKAGAEARTALVQNGYYKTELTASKGIKKEEISAFLEGFILENYEFLHYKSDKKSKAVVELGVTTELITQSDLAEISNTLEGVYLARDLVNEPVITLNAKELSNRMVKAGKQAGFSTRVLTVKEIEDLKMGGLLGVNRGSVDPPTFNIMEWKPKNAVNKKPVVLVGKGIVYDTGGNNLKTGGSMSKMKSDMGGSAAVTGAVYAAAKNKLPLHVIALVPATDNRIDKNALVPDDIITISDGTTVEIQNTDAEGRLVLADALVYARRYNPELVIDFATLTGAAAAVTGSFGIAMMGTAGSDEKVKLTESGNRVYERCAEFPFWKEYSELLKSEIADIKNIGGPVGGASTAGKFLSHFAKFPWIHLDIAGAAFVDKKEPYKPVGGTGVGVRLMYEFLKKRAS